MRGLTIVVGGDAGAADWRTALTLALAQAALGGGARLFLDGAAVTLAQAPGTATALLDEALACGIPITLCQTGLAETGLQATALDPRFDYGGLVGLLATLADDRLVTF